MSEDQSPEDGTARFQKELLSGTVSLLLLSLLERAEEPLYGYQIARGFEPENGAGPTLKRGTLYPALRSLEARGLLSSHLAPSDSGPARKYYSITEQGRRAAAEWRQVWRRTSRLVESILEERS